MAPMGLKEGFVDQIDAGLLFLGSDGLDQGGECEIAGGAQDALAGAGNERERFRGERIVRQSAAVELGKHERLDRVGGEFANRG